MGSEKHKVFGSPLHRQVIPYSTVGDECLFTIEAVHYIALTCLFATQAHGGHFHEAGTKNALSNEGFLM